MIAIKKRKCYGETILEYRLIFKHFLDQGGESYV